MVVATVSTILFTVMLLVYFVVKNQALQKDLREFRYLARTAEKKSKFTLSTLDSLSGQIEKILLSQLESAYKRGLAKGDDYDKAKTIFSSFEAVVMQCCEHGLTVEEALRKTLAAQEVSLEDVNQFISKQPSEVRMAWAKNSVGSFVMACANLNNHLMNPTAKKPQITDKAS